MWRLQQEQLLDDAKPRKSRDKEVLRLFQASVAHRVQEVVRVFCRNATCPELPYEAAQTLPRSSNITDHMVSANIFSYSELLRKSVGIEGLEVGARCHRCLA